MKTLTEIIAENPDETDAQIVAIHNAQQPEVKASGADTRVTYLWIGDQPSPLGLNVAGAMSNGLEAWIAGPDLSQFDPLLPSPSALKIIHLRLLGDVGLDLTSLKTPGLIALLVVGVPQAGLLPVLTNEQATVLLSIGWNSVVPVDDAEVAAARAIINQLASLNALRDQVNVIVGKVDVLFDRHRAGEVLSVPTIQELMS